MISRQVDRRVEALLKLVLGLIYTWVALMLVGAMFLLKHFLLALGLPLLLGPAILIVVGVSIIAIAKALSVESR